MLTMGSFLYLMLLRLFCPLACLLAFGLCSFRFRFIRLFLSMFAVYRLYVRERLQKRKNERKSVRMLRIAHRLSATYTYFQRCHRWQSAQPFSVDYGPIEYTPPFDFGCFAFFESWKLNAKHAWNVHVGHTDGYDVSGISFFHMHIDSAFITSNGGENEKNAINIARNIMWNRCARAFFVLFFHSFDFNWNKL